MLCVLVSNLDKIEETWNTTALGQQLTTNKVRITAVTLPVLRLMDTELDMDGTLILPFYKLPS